MDKTIMTELVKDAREEVRLHKETFPDGPITGNMGPETLVLGLLMLARDAVAELQTTLLALGALCTTVNEDVAFSLAAASLNDLSDRYAALEEEVDAFVKTDADETPPDSKDSLLERFLQSTGLKADRRNHILGFHDSPALGAGDKLEGNDESKT